MSNEKIKVVIERSRWRFGGNKEELIARMGLTMLKNPSGYMCCLGFIGEALGRPVKDIHYPAGSTYRYPELGPWPELTVSYSENGNVWVDTQLSSQAARLNDDNGLTREQREERLKELFRDTRYEIEFSGEYNEDQP